MENSELGSSSGVAVPLKPTFKLDTSAYLRILSFHPIGRYLTNSNLKTYRAYFTFDGEEPLISNLSEVTFLSLLPTKHCPWPLRLS